MKCVGFLLLYYIYIFILFYSKGGLNTVLKLKNVSSTALLHMLNQEADVCT